MPLNRRRALGLLALSAAVAPSGAVGARPARKPRALPPLPLDDPAFHLLTLAKLQGDLSGRPVYGYSRGKVFGLTPGEGLALADYGRRLYDYEGGSVSRSRRLADGNIETVSRSFLFYTDPETGAYLTQWRNPVTGRLVPVPPFRGGISGSVLTPLGPKVSANFTMESTVFGRPPRLEFVVMGDQCVVSRVAFTRWTPKGATKARTEYTQDDWVVATADLLDPTLTHLPAASAWTSQTEWQTWLDMPPGTPGAQLWRANGIKTHRLEDLPAGFLEQVARTHPGILTDPLDFPA
ncbi:DUF1838 family protein [Thermaurantiacus sp.]